MVSELEASIKLGNRDKGTIVTTDDGLTAIIKTPDQALIWDQDENGLANLILSLQNQDALVSAWSDFSLIFGLGAYSGSGTPQSAVFRALVGELEASITLGTRTKGTVVTTDDALQTATQDADRQAALEPER